MKTEPFPFDPSEVAATVMDLIRHRSDYPEATEESCCRRIAEILDAEGIGARMVEAAPGRPNVQAVVEGSEAGPTIILNGHVDVVPADAGAWTHAPFEPVLDGERIYGRGAADMKGGVASCLLAAIALKRAGTPFPGRVILYFNADEERTNLGMRKFLEQALDADFAIVAEPTENAVHVGHRGVSRWRVRTSGRPGHVALEAEPENAVEDMAVVVSTLKSYRKSLSAVRHPILGSASAGVTLIKGGSAANVVPAQCEIVMDRRLLPGESRESIDAGLRRCLDACGVAYELENESWLDASLTPPDHPMIERLRDAVTGTTGACEIGVFPATCEAPFFSLQRGIPTAIFGPGSIAQAHVNDEFVSLGQVMEHGRSLVRFLRASA